MALTQVTSIGIADGTVVAADIGANSVDSSELVNGAVDLGHLSASGTASNSTYLRGDNSWAAVDLASKLSLTGGTLTGNVIHNDNVKALFGTGSDLQIFHTGSHGFLACNTNYIHIEANKTRINSPSSSEHLATFNEGGSCELYYDGTKKFETTSTGGTLTGNLTVTGEVIASDDININADNKKLNIGASADLQLYHNGTASYIKNSTGNLNINTGGALWIDNVAGNETYIKAVENGAVELYYDNSKKLNTNANGVYITDTLAFANTGDSITLADNQKLSCGNGGDLKIFHDGSHNYLDTRGGNLYLRSVGDTYFQKQTTSGGSIETMAKFVEDGAVELYYDNVKRFETENWGCEVHGQLHVASGGSLKVADSVEIQVGDGADLKIYHDGSDSYINETGTGDLILDSSHIVFKDGGTEVFETTNTGVRLKDSKKLLLGSGNDIEIYHDGSHSYVKDAGTGNLRLTSDSNIWIEHGAENMIVCNGDGAVELYYDNSKKFETKSYGVRVYGDVYLPDSEKLLIGTDNDLQIFHDGSHGYLNCNTGFMHITGAYVRINSPGGEQMIEAIADGAVNLRHNGSKKFETTTDGIQVTGKLFSSSHIDLADDIKLLLGTSDDLHIYHDGNHSYVLDNGIGELRLTSEVGGVRIMRGNHNTGIFYNVGAQVELYYDNSKKLETTSTGGTLTGAWSGVGKILQVLQSYRTSMLSTTSSSYVDILTQSITPSSTSSKILIFFQGQECMDAGDGNTYSRYKLMRGSTSVYNGDNSGSAVGASAGRYGRQSNYQSDAVHIMYLDSPSTTSAITYKIQFISTRGSSWRVSIGGSLRTSFSGDTRVPTNLVLMEVAA